MTTIGNLIYPRRLEKGDSIAVVAPAGPFDHEEFHQGLKVLEGLGFQVHASQDLYAKTGYLAGSDTHRFKILRESFENTAIKAVICARGGYGSTRLLNSIDFPALRANPKIFIGFSDVTALLSAIYSRSGLVTFHGPVVTTLGRIDQFSIDALHSTVSSSNRTPPGKIPLLIACCIKASAVFMILSVGAVWSVMSVTSVESVPSCGFTQGAWGIARSVESNI